jgi:RNA polymerase sigma factor (sigma-70 family)
MSRDDLISELHEGRQRFLALVEGLRPELHRYCARMTGSLVDGEDIVQETLARAYYVLPELVEVPPLRPWLFRIAHNRALDHLRRYDRRMGQSLELVLDNVAEELTPDPEEALAQEQAVRAAVGRFVELPPSQRSCVILKDVLGHSLEEIGDLLSMTVPAVKAALHRGRAQLRAQAGEPEQAGPTSPAVARYAALFNARDWDGVREMLADDVRLDLVSRAERAGRREVGTYLTNYDSKHDWQLVPAWLEGREVVAVLRTDGQPPYFVELQFRGEKLVYIRDFRYVPYIAQEAAFVLPAG